MYKLIKEPMLQEDILHEACCLLSLFLCSASIASGLSSKYYLQANFCYLRTVGASSKRGGALELHDF